VWDNFCWMVIFWCFCYDFGMQFCNRVFFFVGESSEGNQEVSSFGRL
jgi:hypothetical protein